MIEHKYFTKKILIQYNRAAIREKRNRQLDEEYLESLPNDIILLVVYTLYHTKDEIRVQLIFDEKRTTGFLDMSRERYELLPEYTLDSNGNVILKKDEEIEKRFPYKNREWTQKVVKKPYRNQNIFRKKILCAYDNKCAICGVNEPKILRAAHIVPVSKGGNDEVQNGICLCTNHEIAYDRGIIKISPDGYIEVYSSNLNILNKKIKYPLKKEYYPSKKFLKMKYINNFD